MRQTSQADNNNNRPRIFFFFTKIFFSRYAPWACVLQFKGRRGNIRKQSQLSGLFGFIFLMIYWRDFWRGALPRWKLALLLIMCGIILLFLWGPCPFLVFFQKNYFSDLYQAGGRKLPLTDFGGSFEPLVSTSKVLLYHHREVE